MRNIKLTIEYDGTAYAGWQIQPGQLTLQGILEERIGTILNHQVILSGSGRTDAGVHALNQVANFKTESLISCHNLQRGINALLPLDIAVKMTEEVDEGFHSRFSARGKVYIYQILNSSLRSAFKGRYAWHIRAPLDMERMNEAASLLIGEHDFSTFRASSCGAPHPVKEVRKAFFTREGDQIFFEIEASGFLHHMVRNIVGTLMEIGEGKRPPISIASILASKNRRLAGITAPPQGLFLKAVIY